MTKSADLLESRFRAFRQSGGMQFMNGHRAAGQDPEAPACSRSGRPERTGRGRYRHRCPGVNPPHPARRLDRLDCGNSRLFGAREHGTRSATMPETSAPIRFGAGRSGQSGPVAWMPHRRAGLDVEERSARTGPGGAMGAVSVHGKRTGIASLRRRETRCRLPMPWKGEVALFEAFGAGACRAGPPWAARRSAGRSVVRSAPVPGVGLGITTPECPGFAAPGACGPVAHSLRHDGLRKRRCPRSGGEVPGRPGVQ